MQLKFGNMTLELNIFHLNNKHRMPEDENQMTDEVGSIGQHSGKLSVQELQGIVSQGEEEVLVLPSTPTVRQLINSEFISEDQVTNGKSNTMEPAQDQRLAQCHSMLQQIMTHLGLPRVPDQRDEPAVAAASLDVLAAAAVATDPPPPQQ